MDIFDHRDGSGEALFHVAPMQRVSTNEGFDLVYFPLSDKLQKLPPGVVDALEGCVYFRSLRVHAGALRGVVDDPLQFLMKLTAASGALISYDSVPDKHREPCPSTTISCLGIPTGQRPYEVERALESYLQCARQYDRCFEVFVSDDSRDRATQENTKSRVASVASSSQFPLYYAGEQEKVSFLQQLKAVSEAPADVIGFALGENVNCPVKTGANRNAILLHTAGQFVLSADDDTICRVGSFSDAPARRGLTFGGDSDNAEFWLFPDPDAAGRAVKSIPIDIFAEHERLLGKTLGGLLRNGRCDPLEFRNPCAHLLCGLRSGDGYVSTTFSGVLGDCGLYSAASLALHTGESTRKRLFESEEMYSKLSASREVGRQHPSATICHIGAPMTTTTGLDNRNLLPPFIPGYRNQDGVFVATLKRCLPASYFGHLPYVVTHRPQGEKTNECNWASTVRISDLLIDCISGAPEPRQEETPANGMMSAGKYLMELGNLGGGEFDEFTGTCLQKRAMRLIVERENLLARFGGEPGFWARDVRRQIDQLNDFLRRPAFRPLDEIGRNLALHEVRSIMQTLVRRFGELLYWWPHIMESAKALAKQQIRIGRQVMPA